MKDSDLLLEVGVLVRSDEFYLAGVAAEAFLVQLLVVDMLHNDIHVIGIVGNDR